MFCQFHRVNDFFDPLAERNIVGQAETGGVSQHVYQSQIVVHDIRLTPEPPTKATSSQGAMVSCVAPPGIENVFHAM